MFLKFYHRAKRLGSSKAINSIMGGDYEDVQQEAVVSEIAEIPESSEEENALLSPRRADRFIGERPESL